MKAKLDDFYQTRPRAWVWFALMMLQLLGVLVGLFNGQFSMAIADLFVAFLIFWCDQLEKEVTRRNLAARKNDVREV